MPFHIHNVLDFGTTEPWVARLWLGIFQFRDFVDTGTKRLAFDQKYAPILDNLYECYRAMILLHKTIAEHGFPPRNLSRSKRKFHGDRKHRYPNESPKNL